MSGPEFDALVGAADEVQGEERERLRATHDLLVQAGRPAELPPWLEQPPAPWLDLAERRRRRAEAPHKLNRFLLPAGAAAAAFVIGLTIGGGHSKATAFKDAFQVRMHGTQIARGADAVIDIGYRNADGNVPMILKVSGLKQLPGDGYYELFLTRNGKLAGTCGTFTIARSVSSVQLNVPYELHRGDGWVVIEHVRGAAREPTVLTT